MVLIHAFALLFSVFAHAQQGVVQIDHFYGLNDTDSPATLSPSESQDALNVESNLDGTAVLKRSGFTREASLTVATAPVNGSHVFKCDNGDIVAIVCHDRYCSKSVNHNAFSNFLSTAGSGGASAVPTQWSFVDIDGDLYGANNSRDPVLKYDCTTLTYPTGPPPGSLLALTEDRLIVADTSANPNRIHYSKSGDFTNFTGGSLSVDAWTDDIGSPGDRTTALHYGNRRLRIFKRSSITGCLLGDQYSTRCAVDVDFIGVQDAHSIVSAPGGLYFTASDGTYWLLSDAGIDPISKKISNFIRNKAVGSTRSNTQTTQADFQNGSQSPSGSWDTVRAAGSISNSSITVGDYTTAAFSSATTLINIDTSTANTIKLSSITFRDNWSNNNISGRLNWTITDSSGSWVTVSNLGKIWIAGTTAGEISNVINTSSISFSSGSWSFNHYWSGINAYCDRGISSDCFQFRIVNNAGGDYYAAFLIQNNNGADRSAGIKKKIGNTYTELTRSGTLSYAGGVSKNWEVQRSTDGKIYLYIDSVFIGSTTTTTEVSSSTKVEIAATGVSGQVGNHFTNFYAYQYRSPGSIISRQFDTTFSTPTWGPFSSTFTVQQNINGQVVFYVQVSTSPNDDMYDTRIAASDTIRISADQKRYARYQAEITTFISTQTPTITAVGLPATTTGQYRTQCIEPGTGITAFGILSCAESNLGAGSVVYYSTSASSCANLPAGVPNTWQTSVTNNATLSISTNAAVYIGFRSLLGSSTDQTQIDACTLYWTEGTAAQPVWGLYDGIRNAIYWTATTTASTTSDRLLKYDLNLGYFYPFNLPCTALSYLDNSPYCGSSTGGYWNKLFTTNTDNGSDIAARWKSKDFSGSSPFQETSWNRLSLIGRNKTTGSMTISHSLSNGVEGSHTMSLSTASTRSYIRDNYNIPFSSPANFMNVMFSNNSGVSFEILGMRLDYITSPWKPQNP